MKLKIYSLKRFLSNISVFIGLLLICSCNKKSSKDFSENVTKPIDSVKIKLHTALSNLENTYLNFNSPKAINCIAKIENNYFKDYALGYSNYYGTEWRTYAESTLVNDSLSIYDKYKRKLNRKPDSLHCTIYAYKGLSAGLDKTVLNKLTTLHKNIWKEREIAGWSIGYLLVKHFNWKAYHIVSKHAQEYKHCNDSYIKNKTYPVWKQPAIPLEKQLIIEDHKKEIETLLNTHEFGWGFSEQGIHTWVTRFNILKECYWGGAPSKKLDIENNKSLFIDTPFFKYYDYSSHIIIYPPKKH